MRGPILLFLLSLKRARMLLIGIGFLLALFQVIAVLAARSMQNDGEFEQVATLLPRFVRDIYGPALTSILSFPGLVCSRFFDIGVIIALVALSITLATLPASEMENGFADLILARPLPRHWIITRTIALVLFSISLMLLIMVGILWAGLVMFAPPHAPWPSAHLVGSLALNLGMLMLCWSGVAMALGATCRRGVASTVTALLVLGTLLLEHVGKLWSLTQPLRWLSPFRYCDQFELVMGEPLLVENLLVLWAIAMTGFTLAYLFMSQRDISR